MIFRIGFGYDVHKFAENRELWIGGVKLDYSKGLLGHSDADVLIHSICDAILGAANMRDIGFHFPDTAEEYKGVDSKILLKETIYLVRGKGFEISNIDATICAENPKMNHSIPTMKAVMANILNIDEEQISIKATTTEKLGFVGKEEGIATYAVVLLSKD